MKNEILFDQVLELLRRGSPAKEINNLLSPLSFCAWKARLSESQRQELDAITRKPKSLKSLEPKINRDFEYLETSPSDVLPLGLNNEKA
jgi:hypothetical protein